MKMTFRLYRRGKTYYAQNNDTGEQESLRTKDKATATRLLNAKNESTMLMGSNLLVARAYMVASDPEMPKRTWKDVIDFIIDEKPETARHRWTSVKKDKALARLWKLRVVETRAAQFITMLKKGTVSTNTYLRRLHNYAFDMNWLAWPILPKRRWPKIVYGEKRGITLEEHRRIIEAEAAAARRNQGSRTGDQPHYNERRDYYELLWFTGGSQSDIASLHAEDIDSKDSFLVGHNPWISMMMADALLADFYTVKNSTEQRALRARDTARIHQESVLWLKSEMACHDPARTIVVTHHAPSRSSEAPARANSPLNPTFTSDLNAIIEPSGIALWIHGHTLYNVDYRIGATRVLSNQWSHPEQTCKGFDPGLVVEV